MAAEQQKLKWTAQEACANGVAAPMAPCSSKGKCKLNLVSQIDDEYPPAIVAMSQISNLN